MKRSILIGSIFACFLMLMIPNISAFEWNTINNSGPDIDEEELKNAILERIKEMNEQDKKNSISDLTWEDPDGPLTGGLDDYMDYYSLFISILFTSYILKFIKEGYLKSSETIRDFVGWVIVYGQYSFRTLTFFGEAFDVYDMAPSDGK